MTVVELDDVRHSLRLSKKQVCLRAGINQSTYQRWLKWARGEPDGCQPHPRSIRALREALSAEFEPCANETPNAGESDEALAPDQARDSRKDGEAAGNPGGHLKAAGSDRAA